MKHGLTVKRNNVSKLLDGLATLTAQDVLVGVPREEAERKGEVAMSNAALAYIHDTGAPEAHIPARPFMRPGIKRALPKLAAIFKQAGQAALAGGGAGAVEAQLNRAGLVAQAEIRATINEGIPPPLKPATVAARRRGRGTKSQRKGERAYLARVAAGESPAAAQSATGIKPLLDTGQLRNSINYVVRKK